ncbi:MAG: lysozyme inhibitor LprI family protein [Paracoccaceae bacterium]
MILSYVRIALLAFGMIIVSGVYQASKANPIVGFIVVELYDTGKDILKDVAKDKISGYYDTYDEENNIARYEKLAISEFREGRISEDNFRQIQGLITDTRGQIASVQRLAQQNSQKIQFLEERLASLEGRIVSYKQSTVRIGRDYQPVFSPGFDCKRASTTAEKVLCTNLNAAQADNLLNVAYREKRSRLSDSQRRELRNLQRSWLRERDSYCRARNTTYETLSNAQLDQIGNCLASATAQRIHFLKAF